MDKEKTKVLFRVFSSSEVLALFPELPASPDPETCLSYQHAGQHGAADYTYVIAITKPANLQQISELGRELADVGYVLKIIYRAPYKVHQQRHKKLIQYLKEK